MKILMVEDDPLMVKLVAAILETRWPDVSLISTLLGKEGVGLAKKELPDLIILDLMLPDMDGFRVLRQIRDFSNVPLIIITLKGSDADKIRGLEEGADDYIVKPFSPGEFVARLQSLIRRTGMTQTNAEVAEKPFTRGRLTIDFTNHMVSVGGKPLKMGPREYELLYYLVTNEDMVLSNQMLMKEVFPEQGADIQFVEVYIKKLRERLEKDPDIPTMILNEGSTGYKFVSS